ncbi:Farnesyl pyrophosphate synthase [Aphelenchoides bicaudatus]|nr:Farnesyl pyrophosphate synthase [Aphelenchoides bicaudatus]
MSLRLIQSVSNEILHDTIRQFTNTLRNREAESIGRQVKGVFDHCMGGGKFGRSCLALDTFQALKPNANAQELHRAAKVSMSLELLQSFFLVMDDIMDGSKLRRGKPCWYRMPGIGMNAINHGLQLNLAVNEVIYKEMEDHPRLYQMLRDVQQTKTITVIGQELDCTTQGPEDCTWDRYEQLVHHKTCHYSYTLPIRMGFHLANRDGYEALTPLTYKLGFLFQSQDDYLDCFGQAEVTGKDGTDLAEGKCTWFSCKTLELLKSLPNPDLQRQFLENFGHAEKESVTQAKEVMKQLKLVELFRQFEKQQIKDIENDINNVDTEEVRPLLHQILQKMNGRKH